MTQLGNFATFEAASLTGALGVTATAGTPSADGTAKVKGTYSARLFTLNDALSITFAAEDEVFVSIYINIAARPASTQTRALFIRSLGASRGAIWITSTGTLQLRNSGGTQVGSDSAALTNDTVYRIGFHYKKGTGANAELHGYLATGDAAFGAAFASSTTLTNTGPADEVVVTNAVVNMDGYWDDIDADDTTMPGPSPVPTRFYLPSSGAAAVSPGYDAGWEETGDADRLKMVTTKIASAMTDKNATTLITAGDTLCRQYVSDALDAQTVSGNVFIYARAFETLATVDAISRIVLKVVSNDGSTVRGTLLALADYSGGAEWNTSLRNKSFANGDTPSSVAAQAGDRLALEIGFNHAAVISSAAINFGDNSATDLPQDETTTSTDNPWLEVGQVLTFQAVGASIVPVLMRQYRQRRN